MKLPFYTIGHSTRSIDEFVSMLNSAGVIFVVDVRTVPRSRMQFASGRPYAALINAACTTADTGCYLVPNTGQFGRLTIVKRAQRFTGAAVRIQVQLLRRPHRRARCENLAKISRMDRKLELLELTVIRGQGQARDNE
jgi:hypothetical protein